jgi:large subunit ribosomal protein L31
MKAATHPVYKDVNVQCACGHSFQTRGTLKEYKTDICSNCHPFYTGQHKLIDTAGRVERFMNKYAKTGAKKASK